MVVGTCELDFHPEVAELDRWQVLSLGVTCASNDRRHANEILSKIVEFVEDQIDGAILQQSRIELINT